MFTNLALAGLTVAVGLGLYSTSLYSKLVVYQVLNLHVPYHYANLVRLCLGSVVIRHPDFCVEVGFYSGVVEDFLRRQCDRPLGDRRADVPAPPWHLAADGGLHGARSRRRVPPPRILSIQLY
jgi:hypothetical protein